jgi:hypothetical protein
MKARDVYEIRRIPAPTNRRWWRRLGELVALVAVLGPVPAGGETVLIVERAIGETVGSLRQPFGNEFYAARLEEDLLVLSPEAFSDNWLSRGDDPQA